MCFSANASFTAGIVLSAIGVAAIKKAKSPSQIPFAAIPLIFAVQQAAEGFLWLTLPDPEQGFIQNILTHIFLFFAQVVWPVWVPIAVILLEKGEARKKTQKVLVATGAIVSAYLAYCLFRFHVHAEITGHHVFYRQDYPPVLSDYGGILYVIATIFPPFFSRVKKMWMLGTAILISYIITTIFYEDYIVSVWCFFASVISILVYVIMLGIEKSFSLTDMLSPEAVT